MAYSLVTKISNRKGRRLKKGINFLILVAAIPVVIIGAMSTILFEFVSFLINSVNKSREPVLPDYYHEEITIVDQSRISVALVEDEADTELSELNETWNDSVYGGDTYLYRVKTNPIIPELHNSICGYFIKEFIDGVLLQQLTPSNRPLSTDTRLIFISYADKSVSIVGPVGPFYLFNDENSSSIQGLNLKHKIEINITSLPK